MELMPAATESAAELMNSTIKLLFDGGSKGNPGKAYGSYIYWGLIEKLEPTRVTFSGSKTNNQAEYMTLITGIQGVLTELEQLNIDADNVDIHIRSDSELLVKQINGLFKVKSKKLKPLHAEATKLLSSFQEHIVEWHSRTESLRWLGH